MADGQGRAESQKPEVRDQGSEDDRSKRPTLSEEEEGGCEADLLGARRSISGR